ncbi:unnamed protein product, partial [Aphanomyces euteiches]
MKYFEIIAMFYDWRHYQKNTMYSYIEEGAKSKYSTSIAIEVQNRIQTSKKLRHILNHMSMKVLKKHTYVVARAHHFGLLNSFLYSIRDPFNTKLMRKLDHWKKIFETLNNYYWFFKHSCQWTGMEIQEVLLLMLRGSMLVHGGLWTKSLDVEGHLTSQKLALLSSKKYNCIFQTTKSRDLPPELIVNLHDSAEEVEEADDDNDFIRYSQYDNSDTLVRHALSTPELPPTPVSEETGQDQTSNKQASATEDQESQENGTNTGHVSSERTIAHEVSLQPAATEASNVTPDQDHETLEKDIDTPQVSSERTMANEVSIQPPAAEASNATPAQDRETQEKGIDTPQERTMANEVSLQPPAAEASNGTPLHPPQDSRHEDPVLPVANTARNEEDAVTNGNNVICTTLGNDDEPMETIDEEETKSDSIERRINLRVNSKA